MQEWVSSRTLLPIKLTSITKVHVNDFSFNCGLVPGTYLLPNVLNIKKIYTRKVLYVQLCRYYLQCYVHRPPFRLCSNCLEHSFSHWKSLRDTTQCSCSSHSIFPKIKKKESPPFCQKILNQIKEYKIDKNLSNIFLVNNVLSCTTSLTPT